MANSIAKLAVHIVANAAGVKTGIDAASGMFSKFGKSVSGFFSGGALGMIGRAFAPITNLLSGAVTSHMGSMTDKFKDLAAAATETSRDAQRLGLPVEDLMGLQFAAQRSGVDVEQLNKALFHLARNEGGNVFDRLMEKADRFTLDDGINKAAMAFDAFGKNGFAVSNMLAKGSDGIKAMMQQGRDLGVVLSAVDVGNLAEANSTLKMIGLAVDGLYNKILVQMAPAITNVGQMMLSMAPTLGTLADAAGRMFGDTLETGVMLLKIVLEQVLELGQTWAKMTEVAGAHWGEASNGSESFRSVLKLLAKAFAYVWDTAKVGAGVFMTSVGAAMVAVGTIADKLKLSWGTGLKVQGAAMAFTGIEAIRGFGKTADAVDKAWDGMFKKQEAKAKAVGVGIEAAYHATSAAIEGSREDMSIRARFSFEGMQARDPKIALQRQQLAAEQATAAATKSISDQMKKMQALNIF